MTAAIGGASAPIEDDDVCLVVGQVDPGLDAGSQIVGQLEDFAIFVANLAKKRPDAIDVTAGSA